MARTGGENTHNRDVAPESDEEDFDPLDLAAPEGSPGPPAAPMAPADERDQFWEDLAHCDGDVAALTELILRRVVADVGEGAVLARVVGDYGMLQNAAVHHPDPAVEDFMRHSVPTKPFRPGEGLAGRAAETRQPVRMSVPNAAPNATDPYPLRAVLAVPLVARGELQGTIAAVRVESQEPYANTDVANLTWLAERAAQALADADHRPEAPSMSDYEAMFRHSLDGVLLTLPDGRVLAANPAACDTFQRSEAEICRLGRRGLIVTDKPAVSDALAGNSISGRLRDEVPMRRANGELFMADVVITIFTTPMGEHRICVAFRDVTAQVSLREQLRQKQKQLERQASKDVLSGLLNRRGFLAAGEQVLAFADRDQVPLQLVYIDLDGFKQINDRLGHSAGDDVIRRVGRAISGVTRAVDRSARMGGDEFVLLLFGASPHDARTVINRVVATSDSLRGNGPSVGFSAGISSRPPDSDLALFDLLNLADAQMYKRKQRRRSRPLVDLSDDASDTGHVPR
jgi:diguanylate cyclase (GGDEF)-like protein/PAS domain S-box-containing protein